MALDFNNSDSKTFLSKGNVTNIPVAAPLTLFAKYNMDELPNAQGMNLIEIARMPPGFGGYHKFQLTILPSLEIRALVNSSGTGSATHAGPAALNTWQSCGGVFTSSTSRTAYFNGAAGTANTDTATASGLEDVLIGVGATVTVGTYNGPFKGCMADVCIWESALTAQNMADLHAGVDPQTISPSTLRLHVPMVDLASGGDAYAWNGSAIAAITDLTLNYTAGSFATCASSPGAAQTIGAYTRIIGF